MDKRALIKAAIATPVFVLGVIGLAVVIGLLATILEDYMSKLVPIAGLILALILVFYISYDYYKRK